MGQWSTVTYVPNGDLYFFHLAERKPSQDIDQTVAAKIREAQRLLSDEAQRGLTTQVIAELKEKGAITLDQIQEEEVEVEA